MLTSAVYNAQTGTTYTIAESDNGKIITLDNASAIAVTLPDTLTTNFQCTLIQLGAGIVTVTPDTSTSPISSDTINGSVQSVATSAAYNAIYLSQNAAATWLALVGEGGYALQGKQTMWVPAGAMRPTVSNPCASLTDVETTAGRPDMTVLDFDATHFEAAR